MLDAGEITRAVTAFARSSNGGLIVTGSPSAFLYRDLIVMLAARHKLPAVYVERVFVAAGGLISRSRFDGRRGRAERYAEIAAELVRLKVDVILTHNTPPVLAAKQATSVIPIVFASAGDPVGTGVVESLARPGGNVTGLSSQLSDTAGKRLELLHEVVPSLRRLAIIGNLGNPITVLEMNEVQAAARTFDLEVTVLDIRRSSDIAPAFDALKGQADALYLCGDPVVTTNRIRINTLALGARLPTMSVFRQYVEAGGLMSYGPTFPDLFRRAADLVDKILRGAKPADIPIDQATKFDLTINLTTAKVLGLAIPESFLLRADEVIE
jgi:putative ABC transport system substrate-binding protein